MGKKAGKMLKLMSTIVILFLASMAVAQGKPQKPLFISYEQRLVLSYLLAGVGESEDKQLEISQRFEKSFNQFMKTPAENVTVSSFAEFLKAYQGHWPDSYSLKSDLQLIESGELRGPVIIRGNTAALQAQIDGFLTTQGRMMVENAKVGSFSQKLATVTSLINSLTSQYRSGKLDFTAQRTYVLAGFKVADDLLKSHLDVIRQTGEAMAQSGKMGSQDGAMSLFLETAFQEYFGRLGLDSKKQIISQFLGHDLNADVAQKFEIMVLNSGPPFQKLLQVVARDAGVSSDLLATFKRLESKTNPIPEPLVRDLFEAERNRYQWISYETSALGTGSMAQVHRGRILTWSGETDVVIRFLKPEIAQRIEEDHRILSEIAPIMDQDPRFKKAGFPKLGPVVNDLNKTILDELDLEASKGRQRRGKEVYPQQLLFKSALYKNSISLSVPGIFDGVPGIAGVSNLMVQEVAEGTKLDNEAQYYQESIPDLKRVLIEEISKVWVDEVFFKSGFFHSDLHQGNFMVMVTDPTIKVSILDFGMGGTISREMQIDLVLLGAGLELNRADVITETLWSLRDQSSTRMTKADLQTGVQRRINEIVAGKMPWQSLSQWTTWAMDSGLYFPYEFVSLNRGLAILDKSLADAGSPLTTSQLVKSLAGRSMRVLFSDLREKGLLSWKDLFKLGWISVQPATNGILGSTGAAPGAKLECSKIHSRKRLSSLSFLDDLLSY